MTIRLKMFTVSLLTVVAIFFYQPGLKANPPPQDQVVKQYRKAFTDQYGFFVTKAEKKALDACKTTEAIDAFSADFWLKRDTDPNTPENEYKEIIDQRILDIKNEIFMTDPDLFGVRFDEAGGLTGEMAHIYLFYGMPHFKKKLDGEFRMANLMTWYYFDDEGYPLFRFLFASKNMRGYSLFTLYNFPIATRLEELSLNMFPVSSIDPERQEEYYRQLEEIIEHLRRKDVMGVFQAAIVEFSYYPDITLQRALTPPDPTGLVDGTWKPATIIGLPQIAKDQQFIFSPDHSLITALFRKFKDPVSARPAFSLMVGYSAVDWEIKDDKLECIMNLRMSFQNKETRKITEFSTFVVLRGEVEVIKANFGKYFIIDFGQFKSSDQVGSDTGTMHDLIEGLAPGDYVVNLYLKNIYTKKYFSNRDEITIK